MIRRLDNIPDDMRDLMYELNNAACRYYKFASYYGSEEAEQIASEIYDICDKHGLYKGRF